MGREDYPYCLDCGEKVRWVRWDAKENLLILGCLACGSSVEIQMDAQDEGLLQDSGGREGGR